MSRVEASSGARYSTHKEQARKVEPIAPVGSSYTPVGKVDINALKKAPPPASKPSLPSATTRPVFGSSKPAVSAGSIYGRTVNTGKAPTDAWPEEKTQPAAATSPPPPATSRPPVLPTAARPTFSAMVKQHTLALHCMLLILLLVFRPCFCGFSTDLQRCRKYACPYQCTLLTFMPAPRSGCLSTCLQRQCEHPASLHDFHLITLYSSLSRLLYLLPPGQHQLPIPPQSLMKMTGLLLSEPPTPQSPSPPQRSSRIHLLHSNSSPPPLHLPVAAWQGQEGPKS